MAGKFDRAKGDIRDLYAYYRFSDHAMTNIVLKDASLTKEEIWFEGHMNWSFVKCSFTKSFHFGVSGSRLTEDTRGTVENEEPFPPYGSNGLNFSNCTMTKPFEIKDNCVAVFVNCTFTDTLTIEDNCKAEFIECTFTKGITFKTFCEVKFSRCDLTQTDFCVNAEAHCNLHFNDCTHGNPSQYAFSFDDDCIAIFHSSEQETMSAEQEVVKASNDSIVKIYNYDTVYSSQGNTIDLSSASKFEAHNVTNINSAKGNTFELEDSSLYLKEVQNCIAGQGIILNSSGSDIRGIQIENIVTSQTDAIVIEDSTLAFSAVTTIVSGQGKAISAVNSKIDISTFDTISSAQNIGLYLDGTSTALLRDGQTVMSGQDIAIYIQNGAWAQLNSVDTVSSGSSTAIKVTDGRYTDVVGTIRQAQDKVINGTNSTVEVKTVPDFTSSEGIALSLTDCVYHFNAVDNIEGKSGGAIITNSKGVLQGTQKIASSEGVGLQIDGCSGPTEWDIVGEISASVANAMSVSGDLYGFRISGITSITSSEATALVWNQSGGEAYLANVDSITSSVEKAADFTVAGKLRVENVSSVTSEEAVPLSISITSGGAEFISVAEVTAQQSDALTINVSEGAYLYYAGFDTITTEEGTALSGTSQGKFMLSDGSIVTSQQGSAVILSGGGALYSSIKLAGIETISAQEADNHMVGISSCAFVQFHKISSFDLGQGGSSSYIAHLTGIGGNFGRCEVIDCPSFTAAKSRGGLYIRDFFDFDVVCSREKGSIVLDDADGIIFGILGANGRVANFSEIKESSGKATTGILVYGLLGGAPGNVQLWNIDTIEAKQTAINVATYGHVEMYNIGEVKTPEGSPAMRISNGQVLFQGGQSATKLSAKDTSSKALEIIGTSDLKIINIETEASKGKVTCSDAKLVIRDSKINGDFEATDTTGEIHDTEFNTSVKLTESRLEFYSCPIALGSQAGEAQDLDVGDSSSAYLFKSPVTGSGEVKGTGVIYGDIESISPKITTSGVLILNKSTTAELDLSGTTLFNDVTVNGNATCTDSSAIWNKVDVSNSVLLDGDGIIANNLSLSSGLVFTGNEGGIFNRFDGSAGSVDLSANSGVIFNHLAAVYEINIPSDCGAIVNQVISMSGDFEILEDSACILNRVNAGANTDYTINGTSGVIGSYLKGNNLTLVAQSGSDAGGLLGSYVFLEGDLTINKNTSVLADAICVEGDITINAEGCMASIGSQFSNPPEGDGVILDMGPVSGAVTPRQQPDPGEPATWPTEVDGLYIHADSTSTKNAVTMIANDAYTVTGDAFSSNSDVVSYANTAAVLNSAGLTYVRQGYPWPAIGYNNQIKMYTNSSSDIGMLFESGDFTSVRDYGDYCGVFYMDGAQVRLRRMIAETRTQITMNPTIYSGGYSEDYILFGRAAEVIGAGDLTMTGQDTVATPPNYSTSIVLHGDTGIQNRYAPVKIDDNAPTIDHNYT